MTTGGTPAPRRRRSVAGRGRSLTPPTPSVSGRQRISRTVRRVLEWSGWTKAAAISTTVAAIGALWFTNQSLRATDNQYALSQQVAVTDRFQKAAEQLASDKIDVRLSGIYLLERLAKDSTADHPTVFAVLSAFLRTHTNVSACPTTFERPPVDIQAALTAIGRRDVSHDGDGDNLIDVPRTCLAAANLVRANLARANLIGANLTNTILDHANLTSTFLVRAILTGAILDGAILTGANLKGADLTYTYLIDANLSYTDLTGANLKGAYLKGAYLTNTDLSDIYYDVTTQWPDGFTPPKSRPGP